MRGGVSAGMWAMKGKERLEQKWNGDCLLLYVRNQKVEKGLNANDARWRTVWEIT